MNLVYVTEANYVSDFKVSLKFNDGLSEIVDLKNYLDGEVFEPLNDINYFKRFSQDSWTICWDCGADFAPEFLYELAMKQKNKTTTNKVQKAMP